MPDLDHRVAVRLFAGPAEHAEVCVIVVTFNNLADLPDFLTSLRAQALAGDLRVVVVDNGSTDGTVEYLSQVPDLTLIRSPGNLGYAGGVNLALGQSARCNALLVVNADLVLRPGAISAMIARLKSSRAAVVVPLILTQDGSRYPSLRREPSLSRALGDALLGSRLTKSTLLVIGN